ncbi:spore germination protein [Fictibacillus iocasae]|uniref:Spore germination protein n=1 Tax=Fictibacillus iocasae TaxID=2715437 RepID=A0ABW2P047_9BACL
MPSLIVAPININSANGQVNFGDSFIINPKSTGKTYSGAGGGNTGNFVQTVTVISGTNTIDTDAFDSNNAGNA